jgi:hypothetical protein
VNETTPPWPSGQRSVSILCSLTLISIYSTYLFNFKKCPENDEEPEVIKIMGWKVPTYVVEPEESYVLNEFISFPTPKLKSLKLIVSHNRLKKYRFPGRFEDASEIGSNHMQRLEDKRDTFYYTKPTFKKWVDDSILRLLTDYYGQFLIHNMYILDLCASWDSHLPEKLQFKSIIGVGIVEEELVSNKRLSQYYVQDLNENPNLQFIDDESIDVVLCTLSVDLLIKVCSVTHNIIHMVKVFVAFCERLCSSPT